MPGPTQNRHCARCGHALDEGEPPHASPTPVAVILVPVDGGLLTVRRKLPPQDGALALPGGTVHLGETWQQAGARQVLEETGVTIDPEGIVDFRAISGDGTVWVFGVARPLTGVPRLTAPGDTGSELVILHDPEPLALAAHTKAVQQYFAKW